jgi:ribose/xylose/arabinose/galactoside ABC-type transport system permease subunit
MSQTILEQPQVESSVHRKSIFERFKGSQTTPLAMIFLAISLVLSLSSDVFLTETNLFSVGRQASINGLLSLGMTFVIIGGGISVGAVVALVSSLVVIMANHGLPVVVVLAGALLAGAVFGLVSGIMVSRFEITPFIATLAGLCAYRGAVLIITDGSPITFNHFSPALNYIGNGLVGPVPFPLIILVVMAVLCHLMATRTRFGLHIFALGSSEEAARLSGIITKRVQCLTYVLSGFLCGIAALIMTARVNSSQPTAGELFELDAIAAAVIGGTSMTGGIGSVPGAMLGVAIFGIIGNGLNLLNVSSYWQYVIRGVIIALAVGIDTYRNRRRK